MPAAALLAHQPVLLQRRQHAIEVVLLNVHRLGDFRNGDPGSRADELERLLGPRAAAAGAPGAAGTINLNTVTFEQLRQQNLSVTQATRLLAHRERLGGFQSVDDLDQVAGFPEDLLQDLKSRSTV
jgi:DNA uptake protein ComE-like DNA-binding protein